MVRTGGIMAFAMILIVPVSGYLFMLVAPVALVFGSLAAKENFLSMLVLMYVVFLAFVAFVFWTTKGLFNASGYRAADVPIMTLIVFLAFAPPVAVLSWTWFSISATGFGRQVGLRLWQAIGIIYLIGMALIAASMTWMAFDELQLPNMGLLMYAALVMLVGWAFHGIGLIVGARKMAPKLRGDSLVFRETYWRER